MFSTEIHYEVVTFSIGDTKAGTKMGKLQLRDPETGEALNCILWEEALNRMDSKLFRSGNLLRIVSASFNEKFNNCLVTALELIKEAKTGLEPAQREVVYKNLLEYINKITDENLRNFVLNIYEENKEQIAFCLYSYVYWANKGQGVYLSNVFVKPEHRKKGILKEILSYIKNLDNVNFITMLVGNENESMQKTITTYGAEDIDMKTFYLK